MHFDVRLAVFMIWGVGAILIWGDVLRDRWRAFRKYRDRRARRALLAGIALFIVAVCSAVSIAFALFGQSGIAPRGFAIAISLGAFLGAGFYMRDAETERES